jgi:hypothetical protein
MLKPAESYLMTTEMIIIHIFCGVDDGLKEAKRVAQTHLYPSEIVTIGILFVLKGGHFRAFYRWLYEILPCCSVAYRIERTCNGFCEHTSIMPMRF